MVDTGQSRGGDRGGGAYADHRSPCSAWVPEGAIVVSLLNAAQRSAPGDVELAYRALRTSSSPADIAEGRVEGVERLCEMRGGRAVRRARRCIR